jgi:hypothetical protein
MTEIWDYKQPEPFRCPLNSSCQSCDEACVPLVPEDFEQQIKAYKDLMDGSSND